MRQFRKIILLSVVLVLLIPLIIGILMKSSLFTWIPGNTNTWITYWGSYLGSIIGMMAVLVTTNQMIINQEELNNKKLETQNKHFNLQLEEQGKVLRESNKNEKERIYISFLIEECEKVKSILAKLAHTNNDRFLLLDEMYQFYYHKEYHKESRRKEMTEKEVKLRLEIILLLTEFISKVKLFERLDIVSDIDYLEGSKDYKHFIDEINQETHSILYEYNRKFLNQEPMEIILNIELEHLNRIGGDIIKKTNEEIEKYLSLSINLLGNLKY